LTDKLEKEEKDKLRQLADKDREKVQATGKLFMIFYGRFVKEGYVA